ncbi:hypothetical protein [Bradyrhizobium sp. Leo121]|uniref:hypothetical protein n=1 Tax=Bradyrhizobium sp. Leo121 TaxID=1571195 RepID=UPI00102A6D99|nr:hypothetical protein [Bradyrhizobium sp. Leo121]
MRVHVDFKRYFDGSAAQPPQCVADDIEQKWENAGHVGRLLPRYAVLSGDIRVALASAETSSADHNAESGLADLPPKTPFEKPF